MHEMNTCAVRGQVQPGAMCGKVIVGGKFCGHDGECEHKRTELKIELSEQQEKKLRHMLGAEPRRYRKNQWGFRNHYAAGRNSTAYSELKEMEKIGLVSQGREGEQLVFFHATEAGCKAIGLNKSQIKRAFDW